MFVYLALQTYHAYLYVLGAGVDTSPQHVEVPNKNIPLLAEMAKSLIKPIDEAIETLESAHYAR